MSLLHAGALCSAEYENVNSAPISSALPSESEPEKRNNITKFDGESFNYNIGFWIFKKMGIVKLQSKKEDNNIIVTIDAYTTGMIDKVLHRHNFYKTTMTLDNDTHKLKPLDTYEKKIKGDNERIKITNYDYVNNIRKFRIWKDGIFHRENEVTFDKKVSDDGISALYNLRNEMYGEIKEGASFNICTVYKDSSTDSEILVRSPKNSDKLSKWNNTPFNASFATDITMDPEIFDSEEGKLVILFTDDLLPIGFIAKDVLGFGDLYGVLKEGAN